MSQSEARESHPAAFQHALDHVKPERMTNRRESIRNLWWRFGWERPKLRVMTKGLSRFISTPETAKHRVFVAFDHATLPDNMLTNIALDDTFQLGILSSRLHIAWALAAGGRLGVGNDPRYNKVRCFETFPFPNAGPEQQAKIRELAERLDAHRKRQQAQFPDLTLTGMYNVLEKMRADEPLTAKDMTVHAHGLISLLRELHDELDRAVFTAYGWDDLAMQLVGNPGATTPLPNKTEIQAEAEEELLSRLVALNSERAAEEARDEIRWLRPELQNPSFAAAPAPEQSELEMDETADFESVPAVAAAKSKLTWPKQMREQVAAVRHALSHSPLPANSLASQFKRSPEAAVQAVLDALEALGMVELDADQYRLAS